MQAISAVRRNRRVEGPLTRSTIVGAALTVVRAEGIEALTMRRLAADLRSAPMSIYRHVEDRQQILVAMLDVVAAHIELPPVAPDPAAEIEGVFTAIHDALRADLWAVTLIVVDKLASADILPAVERVYAAMRSAGLSAADTVAGYALLWQYTVGELLDTAASRTDEYRRRMVQESDRRRFPVVHDVLDETTRAHPNVYNANLSRIIGALLDPAAPWQEGTTWPATK